MPLDISTFLHTWLLPFLAVVMAGCGIWITAKLSGWIDTHAAWLSADQKNKLISLEQSAYSQAVNWILAQVQAKGEKVNIQPDNWLVRQGVQIVLDHPAAVLGSPQDIANKIIAQLPPAVIATDTTGATVKTTTITVETTPPVQEKSP